MSVVSGPQSDLRPLALVPGELECQALGMHIRHEMHGNEEATSKNTQAQSKDDCFQPSPEVAYGRCGPSNDVVRARDILKCSAQPLVTLHGPG